MSARASKLRPAKNDTRRVTTAFSIAPHTMRRIQKLADLLGIARGRIIDLALDAIEPCQTCQGSGLVDSETKFSGLERCSVCRGLRVIPAVTGDP
jgi:hypothetical protein